MSFEQFLALARARHFCTIKGRTVTLNNMEDIPTEFPAPFTDFLAQLRHLRGKIRRVVDYREGYAVDYLNIDTDLPREQQFYAMGVFLTREIDGYLSPELYLSLGFQAGLAFALGADSVK